MRVIIEAAEERVKTQRKIGPHSMQVWHRVSRIARCGLAVAVAVALRAGCGAVSAPVRSSALLLRWVRGRSGQKKGRGVVVLEVQSMGDRERGRRWVCEVSTVAAKQ